MKKKEKEETLAMARQYSARGDRTHGCSWERCVAGGNMYRQKPGERVEPCSEIRAVV